MRIVPKLIFNASSVHAFLDRQPTQNRCADSLFIRTLARLWMFAPRFAMKYTRSTRIPAPFDDLFRQSNNLFCEQPTPSCTAEFREFRGAGVGHVAGD